MFDFPKSKKFKNLTGDRIGRRVVISYEGKRKFGSKTLCSWKCRCDCGNVDIVSSSTLLAGNSSCGCATRDSTKSRRFVHGCSKSKTRKQSPEYAAWAAIKKRCTRKTSHDFKDYGGRGIRVCERWANSFSNFLLDVGYRPSPSHSLDRFPDNDGDYKPGNVRWATQIEQQRNKRSNRIISCFGRTMCLSEWAEITGISRLTISKRIKRGWSVEKSLSSPSATTLARPPT